MRKLILLVLPLLLVGCGTKAVVSTEYTPPFHYQVDNEMIINAPFDKVWKTTVDTLGKSFFTLENIEKDSGIMSFSFSSNEPSKYADCGTIHDSGFSVGKEVDETYNALTSNITRYIMSVWNYSQPSTRNVHMIGKSNVLIRSLTPNQTVIKINTRYIIEINYNYKEVVQVTMYSGYLADRTHSSTITFTGSEPGILIDKFDTLTCYSTFELEKNILSQIQENL